MPSNTVVIPSLDINVASNGDNSIIPAIADKKIYVWKLWLVANAAVNVKLRDGTTDFNGFAIPLTAQGSSITFFYDHVPYLETSKGNAFQINLSGAVQVTGRIYYTYE